MYYQYLYRKAHNQLSDYQILKTGICHGELINVSRHEAL